MRPRAGLAIALLAALALFAWRSQLFTVSRPGERPRALALIPRAARARVSFEVVLPAVPVGMDRLRESDGPLLVHYWAPWERDGATQAARLDSLRRDPALDRLRVVVVCFDPFPSVARYIARQRLRLRVLLEHDRSLRRALPCPSVPYTYVIDAAGRIAIAQSGEVDWFAAGTRAALDSLLAEPDDRAPALPASLPS